MNWERVAASFSGPLFKLGETEVTPILLASFVASLFLVVLLARFIRRILRTRLLARTRLDPGVQYLISRIAGYVVLVLGLLVALQTVGVDLSSLTVLAGALGVGIGFGLQNVVNNFVSGLILMGERSIQVGDRVEVGDAHGRIVHIGARATTVQTNDNISIIVPNSEFVSAQVINWSHAGDPRVRLRIPIGVSYRSDPHQVERLLLEVAAGNEHVLEEPAPRVMFREFGDSSLNFELRIWTSDMTHRPGALKGQLNFAIWDKLKEAGIEIPFPQRDLHIQGPLRVELDSPGQ